MKISAERDDQIITYALGSCLGIAIFDPVACVGGMLHVMLPTSTIDSEKAREKSFMFVDTGVPKLSSPAVFLRKLDRWLEFAHSVTSPLFADLVSPAVMRKFEGK